MDEPIVEVETHVGASPTKVWRAMTATESPMFMGARMETDWRPGSPYTLAGEWNGKPFTDYGEIETAEPERELTITHWAATPERPASYNAVRYRLTPDGVGTRVTLAQFGRGVPKSYDDKAKAEFSKTWATMLDGLKKAAEAG